MSKSNEMPADDAGRPGARDASGADRSDRKPGKGADPDPGPHAQPVRPRRERYLVAPLPTPALPAGMLAGFGMPLDPAAALAQVAADPGCTVVRVIHSTLVATSGAGAGPLGAGAICGSFPEVVVVEMDADRAAAFAASPLLHVEPDLALQYASPEPARGWSFADPGLVPYGETVAIDFEVRGSDGAPLDGAEIYVVGAGLPVRGVTDPDGTAKLGLPAAELHTLTGLYVKPRADHWAVWLARPELLPGTAHAVTCPRLADTFEHFPEREPESWARRAMRFDALPPTYRGHGTRIAVVDSGAALGHPDLAGRVAAGRDVTGGTEDGWGADPVGHGSHCAGVIGGSDNGAGIVGIVPEAELHACKIFPGGRFSDLIEALDYCIANQIDVVNLSLGSPQPSALLACKIEQARQAGVVCVVAAGNSGGPVAFPATLSSVLTVAAIGKMGEFPPGSYHATQVAGAPTTEGYFSPKFTCFGPEVDVCAPGVAIVSCVPPANYAAWDGTSFAAPYVSALAALLLAHHPDFRDRYPNRDAARVDRVFELIKGSCQPLMLGDQGRTGAGLPDALRALGLIPPVPPTPPAHPALAGLWSAMAHAGLVAAPVPIAVPAISTGGTAPAGIGATGPVGHGMAFSTGSDVLGDVLAPLRTALRAAGLLGPQERTDVAAPGPGAHGHRSNGR